MPVLYTTQDTGFPALTLTSNTDITAWNNLKLILKACLVTGYGSKPAAGWVLVDEGEDFLVLRNASGSYVSIVSQGTSSAKYNYPQLRFYLSATYAGMSGKVPTGMGVVSGVASGSSAPHNAATLLIGQTGFGTRMIILADAATALIQFASGSAATSISGTQFDSVSDPYLGTFYLGDDAAGNCLCVGGQTLSSSVPNIYTDPNLFHGGMLTSLNNPATGALVGASGISASIPSLVQRYAQQYLTGLSAIAFDQLELSRIRWMADGVIQAPLRGLCRDPVLSDQYAYAIKRALLGGSGAVDIGVMMTPTLQADGYLYQPVIARADLRPSALITDNPGFW